MGKLIYGVFYYSSYNTLRITEKGNIVAQKTTF